MNKIYGFESNIVSTPRNHDFSFNNKILKRKFNESSLSKKFTYKINDANFDIVVENSKQNNWLFDIEIIKLVKTADN